MITLKDGKRSDMKQVRVERRKALRRLWDEMGRKFIIMYAIALVIVVALPFTRSNALAYFVAFLVTFSIAFFLIFFRAKEKPPELTYGDR